MLKRHFARFARYNAWANRRLYAACASLSEDEYRRERPAFFGSIHRTLNHLLLGDRLWLDRIRGRAGAMPPLDTEFYDDLASLGAARGAEDAAIVALVDGLDGDAALARTVAYRNSSGRAFEDDLATVLAHLFNHQTHHRGQVHDMLAATPVPPPPLDLILFVREGGAGGGPGT